MRIYCLNGDQNYPCFILTIKGCAIMLDCSLDLNNVEKFFPVALVQNQRYEHMTNHKLKNGKSIENIKEYNNHIFINSTIEFSPPEFNLINVEDVDAVLISNYHTMLALPYLTKLKNFRAAVYCTEPTLHMGRILMEELTGLIKSNNNLTFDTKSQVNTNEFYSTNQCKQWKIHSNLLSQLLNISETHNKPHNWHSLYSKEDVDLCISKIKQVGFNERLNLFGSLYAVPRSSGYTIGACNWLIEADCDKIFYLPHSSLLNTHTKSIDLTGITNQIVDCLIISGLAKENNEPDLMSQEFCKAVVSTLKNGGNVLVPTYSTGKIYDLIEYLTSYLNDASLSTIPIYFISQVANQSLAYSNIFAEWLCETKLNQVYAAESPFQHGELVKNGIVKIYPSIIGKFNDDYRQPCIIFASHPSLRFGESCHFVELWKNSPLNSLIFIEPSFNYIECLAPYQPIYANYYYFPIDVGLNGNQLFKIIKEFKHVSQLIISNNIKIENNSCYNESNNNKNYPIDNSNSSNNTSCNNNNENYTELFLKQYDLDKYIEANNIYLNMYRQNDIIKLKVKRRYEKCNIEAELANSLILKPSQTNNIAYSTFSAHLVTKNNEHVLKAAPKTIPLTRRDRLDESNLKRYLHGKLNVEQFEMNIKQLGFSKTIRIKPVENTENIYIIEINKQNKIIIDLLSNSISIINNNEDIRNKIKDCILKCLNTL